MFKKNLGVIFNFLGYGENLIRELNPNFYFSISDDFFQLNSEYLNTTLIKEIDNGKGKKEFCKKFSFFDDISNIVNSFYIKNVSLLISCDGSVGLLEDFDTND